MEVSQAAVEKALRIIGAVDVVLAGLIVITRWRAVAFYMAAWALIAALARVVHAGFGAHYEVLIRAGNYCVPLVIGLSWILAGRQPQSTAASREEPPDG